MGLFKGLFGKEPSAAPTVEDDRTTRACQRAKAVAGNYVVVSCRSQIIRADNGAFLCEVLIAREEDRKDRRVIRSFGVYNENLEEMVPKLIVGDRIEVAYAPQKKDESAYERTSRVLAHVKITIL